MSVLSLSLTLSLALAAEQVSGPTLCVCDSRYTGVSRQPPEGWSHWCLGTSLPKAVPHKTWDHPHCDSNSGVSSIATC